MRNSRDMYSRITSLFLWLYVEMRASVDYDELTWSIVHYLVVEEQVKLVLSV